MVAKRDGASLDPVHFRSVGVTGTNGKTTTTTWLAAALGASLGPVFRATTLGYFLGDERLAAGDGHAGFLQAARAASVRGARVGALELTSQALWGGFPLCQHA